MKWHFSATTQRIYPSNTQETLPEDAVEISAAERRRILTRRSARQVQWYFSGTTRGFYNSTIHTTLPEDAIEISASQRRQLLARQSAGQEIAVENGIVLTRERPAVPVAPEVLRRGRLKGLQFTVADGKKISISPEALPAMRSVCEAMLRAGEESIGWEMSDGGVQDVTREQLTEALEAGQAGALDAQKAYVAAKRGTVDAP